MWKKIKDFFKYILAYWDEPQPDYKAIKIEYHHKHPIVVQSEFVLDRNVIAQYRGAEHQLIHFTKNKLAIELSDKLKKDGLIEYEEYDDKLMGGIKVRAKLTVVK